MGNIGEVTIKVVVDDKDQKRSQKDVSKNVKDINSGLRRTQRMAESGGGAAGTIRQKLTSATKRLTSPLSIGAIAGAAFTIGRLLPSENISKIITGLDKALIAVKSPIQAAQMLGSAQIARDPQFFGQVTQILREDDQKVKEIENQVLGSVTANLLTEGDSGAIDQFKRVAEGVGSVFADTVIEVVREAAEPIVEVLWTEIKSKIEDSLGFEFSDEGILRWLSDGIDHIIPPAAGGNK